MSDKIINMLEENVQACAQFEYRGWTISMSTIMRKGRVEVLTWKDEDKTFNTVQEAVEYINNLEEADAEINVLDNAKETK